MPESTDSIGVMFHHAVNLLSRSWELFVESLGDTTLGFVAPLVLVPMVGFAVALGFIWYRDGWDGVAKHMRQTVTIALLVGIAGEIIVYMPILGWNVVKAIYADHKDLVVRVQTLKPGRANQQPEAPPGNAPRGRVLSDLQKETIKSALDAYSGEIAELYYAGGDPESKKFCGHILDALKMSKWNTKGAEGPCSGMTGEDSSGISVYVNYKGDIPAVFVPLKKALAEVGYPPYSEEYKHSDSEKWEIPKKYWIRIVIGHNFQ